jgi:hypothetical protein
MRTDLTPEQRALADYMSDLSEQAYFAGWMHGLEFALWEAASGQLPSYGRLEFDERQIVRLRALSSACGGWIVFDEASEETWISMPDWLNRFDEWKTRRGVPG